MGRLEKIVVVTVLFIVAVVLAASLNGDGGAAKGPGSVAGSETDGGSGDRGPMGDILASAPRGARVTDGTSGAGLDRAHAPVSLPGPLELEPDAPATGFTALDGGALGADDLAGSGDAGDGTGAGLPAPRPSTSNAPDRGLLAGGALPVTGGSDVEDPGSGSARTVSRHDTSVPAVSIVPLTGDGYLKSTAGLVPSEYDDAYLLYTWREGDSFRSLAERYYGDVKYAYRVAEANEGYRSTDFRPGQQIWIAARATSVSTNGAGSEEPAAGSVYTVQAGDILSRISQDVYGSAKHWKRILEANRHQMATDRDLTVGMELIIPPLQ